jgi:hypothetical protein
MAAEIEMKLRGAFGLMDVEAEEEPEEAEDKNKNQK